LLAVFPHSDNHKDNVMRSIVAAFVFAAAMGSSVTSGHAFGDARWCEVKNLGSDVVWDCEYRTIGDCASHVIAGERSFCNINPYWRDSAAPVTTLRKRQKPRD
jgi:hypothetical protein